MNRRAIIGFLVALALLLGGVATWKRSEAIDALPPLAPAAPAVEPDAPRAHLAPPVAIDDEAATKRTSVEPEPIEPIPTVSGDVMKECRIRARVLDARGSAVEGVAVILLTKTVETDSLPRAKTGADGRFVLVSDRVPASWFSIVVAPPATYARAEVPLGLDAEGNARVLLAGDNDLGDVVLRDRGAVEGRVVSDRGAPIQGAVISVASKSDVMGMQEVTDANGRFLLGGLPEGKVGLQIQAERWLRPPPVTCTITLRETAHLDDVVLSEAPSISGVVLDESGAPVRGAVLTARCLQSVSPPAKSAEDGSFVLWLGAFVPHWIETPPTPEFDAYGQSKGDTTLIEPNTKGVRVVLHRADQVLFRVVDSATRAPIESFALRIQREGPSKVGLRDDGPIVARPGGELRTAARPGVSSVHVAAPGYARSESTVTLDAGSNDTQTIALVAAATIRGRATKEGAPVAGITVDVQREAFGADGRVVDSPRFPPKDVTYDVPVFSSAFPRQTTQADGQFEFTGLVAGTYALTLTDAERAETLVRSVQVAQGRVLDVGDVALVPGAIVRGRLVAPSDESPVGFRVQLSSGSPGDAANAFVFRSLRVDAAGGTFEFRGLTAGTYTIDWSRPDAPDDQTKFTRPGGLRFTLAPSETREVVLDASRSSPCKVDVLVMRAGAPAEGVNVVATVHATNPGLSGAPRDALTPKFGSGSDTRFLGTTNADGRVSASIEGNVTFDLAVMGEGKVVIARSDAPLVSAPRGHIECTLVVRVGAIALEIPASLPPVPDGSVTVSMSRVGGGAFANFWLTSPTASFRRENDRSWTIGVNALGQVPAGDYAVTVTFQRMVVDRDSPKGSRMEPVREPLRTTVTVAEGAEARIVVP